MTLKMASLAREADEIAAAAADHRRRAGRARGHPGLRRTVDERVQRGVKRR
jgi:hypothetical protein